MNLLMDLHTHTVASGHAYSSLEENIKAAKEKGLAYYGVSDHAPKMPGSPHLFYFQNIKVVPRELHGMKVLRGVEANIIDYKGTIDMSPETLTHIDYVIASEHIPCLPVGSMEQNTNAIIGAMKNPSVRIIGHPDDGRYPLDYERVVKAAKEYGVLLEVNNSSLNPKGFRANAKENITKMLELCKQHSVPILINSDAHISVDVGNFSDALDIIEKNHFPEELIMNCFPDKFLKLIEFAE